MLTLTIVPNNVLSHFFFDMYQQAHDEMIILPEGVQPNSKEAVLTAHLPEGKTKADILAHMVKNIEDAKMGIIYDPDIKLYKFESNPKTPSESYVLISHDVLLAYLNTVTFKYVEKYIESDFTLNLDRPISLIIEDIDLDIEVSRTQDKPQTTQFI